MEKRTKLIKYGDVKNDEFAPFNKLGYKNHFERQLGGKTLHYKPLTDCDGNYRVMDPFNEVAVRNFAAKLGISNIAPVVSVETFDTDIYTVTEVEHNSPLTMSAAFALLSIDTYTETLANQGILSLWVNDFDCGWSDIERQFTYSQPTSTTIQFSRFDFGNSLYGPLGKWPQNPKWDNLIGLRNKEFLSPAWKSHRENMGILALRKMPARQLEACQKKFNMTKEAIKQILVDTANFFKNVSMDLFRLYSKLVEPLTELLFIRQAILPVFIQEMRSYYSWDNK